MLRGEFIRGDGLVIPNNITQYGADLILKSAFRAATPAFWVGLVDGLPEAGLLIEQLNEPAIGTHGYARLQLTADSTGWPTAGTTNGEPYLESKFLTWAASGGDFSKPIRRMMLCQTESGITGNVMALSQPLSTAYVITPTTDENLRKFKYRIYLR